MPKKAGKRILLLLLLVLVLAGAATFFFWGTQRNTIARELVVDAITKNGSCEVDLGDIEISPNGQQVSIGRTVFTNPDVPTATPMLEIASLKASLKPTSLLNKNIVLTDLQLHVPQITLVRKADGTTNVDCLGSSLGALLPQLPAPKGKKPGGGGSTAPASAAAATPSKKGERTPEVSLDIERLDLRIDNVAVQDFGRGGPIPASAEVEIDFHESYEKLTSLEDLQNRLKADAEKIVKSLMIF